MKKQKIVEIDLKKACLSAGKTRKFVKELLETQKTKTGRLKVRRQFIELLNNEKDFRPGLSALLTYAEIFNTPKFEAMVGLQNEPLKKRVLKALENAEKKWNK